MQYLDCFQYNSLIILSYFFICLVVLFLNKLTHGKSNSCIFSCGRGSLVNPFTYLGLVIHIFGHENWDHLKNNFLYILLVGPMIEEKYGSQELLWMIGITAVVTGICNVIFSKKRILGASGIVFMLIMLSSLVNLQSGKIPITFVLICCFYVVGEIRDSFVRKSRVSHFSHLLGAVSGFIYGFYYF